MAKMPKHVARSEALKKSVAADKTRLQAHSRADVMDDRQRGASSPLGPSKKVEKGRGR
jgi:hypothetical protein